MLGCLRALDAELRERGSGLVVRDGPPEHELVELAREVGAAAPCCGRATSRRTRARATRRVTTALREAGVEPLAAARQLRRRRLEPRTQGGTPFTVFTPFYRRWRRRERRTVQRAPAAPRAAAAALRNGPAAGGRALGRRRCCPSRSPSRARRPRARARRRWLDGADRRTTPTRTTTVAASRHERAVARICAGAACPPRECEARARAAAGRAPAAWVAPAVLARLLRPRPARPSRQRARTSIQERYPGRWSGTTTPTRLEAWQRGPHRLSARRRRHAPARRDRLDAQPRAAGRRLVPDEGPAPRLARWASATSSALLLDGEPAQNNGNWQWITSVGVDPAPYFRRMFNPVLQQRRFDPDGDYVRRWVPELRGVPDEHLAEPWRMSAARQREIGCVIGRDYPAPIVDHAEERQRAIERYRAVG